MIGAHEKRILLNVDGRRGADLHGSGFAIRSEDDILRFCIRLEGKADGRVRVRQVVEDDGAVVLELFVKLVVLGAGSAAVGKFPLAA